MTTIYFTCTLSIITFGHSSTITNNFLIKIENVVKI